MDIKGVRTMTVSTGDLFVQLASMHDGRLAKVAMEVKAQVEDELDDERFKPHWHGRPIGTNNGCAGPYCRAQQRNRVRPPGNLNHNEFRDLLITLLFEYVIEERKSLELADLEARLGVGAREVGTGQEDKTVA